MQDHRTYLAPLIQALEAKGIAIEPGVDTLHLQYGKKHLTLLIAGTLFDSERKSNQLIIPLDQIMTQWEKVSAILCARLGLNQTVFARNCSIGRPDKVQAADFLNRYHLMNATQSAYTLGLFYKEELIALATFSKGRKMNRLREDQRSFELIRFCTKSGITVTGGLSKLLKHFCKEKKAGDIMTYVDKQLSDGNSFIRAGFKKHSETEPNYFLVHKTTFARTPAYRDIDYDASTFYLSRNDGNIKLVFTP